MTAQICETEDVCADCEDRRRHGRKENGPIHCRDCHQTWTGNNAQHCVKCHTTFSGLSPADHHRYRKTETGTEDRCIDPAATDGWREVRPGVWTDSEPMPEGLFR